MRIARIRRRALAAVAGTFVLAWGVISVQLATGHDPALAKHASVTSSSTGAAPRTSASGSTGSGSTSSGSAASAPNSSSASPITTSQS